MNLVIDGGGTSTKVYLVDKDKKIFRKEIFDGINPQTHEVKTLKVLKQIADDFSEQYKQVYIGAPGMPSYRNRYKIDAIFNAHYVQEVNVLTDIEIHEFLHCHGDNYFAIAIGSGTIMIENNHGKKRILSGFGPLFSDEGSAFSFAKFFFREAIRKVEREDKNNWFLDRIFKYYGWNNYEDLKDFYNDWNSVKPRFLAFTKWCLAEEYVENNEIKQILMLTATEFNEWFNNARFERKDINIIYLFGGMFKNEIYCKSVTDNLKQKGYEIQLII